MNVVWLKYEQSRIKAIVFAFSFNNHTQNTEKYKDKMENTMKNLATRMAHEENKSAYAGMNDEEVEIEKMQINFQNYLAELQEKIQQKKETMYIQKHAGETNSKTSQRWFGDQILHSANHLSVNFVEEVLSYTMQ